MGIRRRNKHSLSQSPSLCLIIQSLDVRDQIPRLVSASTVLPLTAIIHTPYLIVYPDRAADPRAHILTVLDAVPQQTHAVRARVLAHAFVQHLKVKTVFERAVLDELTLRYLWVLVDQAVCEAEVQLGVRVLAGSAEEDNVAEAFGLAVLALDAVVFVGESGCLSIQ
jgi:hypothetical protein